MVTPLVVHMPSVTELLIISGVLVLLFGAKKVPELMKGIGSGVRELRGAFKDESGKEIE